MGLERRGNNLYYYEKERIGCKVRSIYVGSGETAYLFHLLNLLKRDEAEDKKQTNNKEIKLDFSVQNEIDSVLDLITELNRNLTDAFYLTNGFHQHKRQWRRKRNENKR